jgi:hypothetical protein
MIEAARKRGLYDMLIVGDIETELTGSGVLQSHRSADTMTYFAILLRCFGHSRAAGARRLLSFASEAKTERDGKDETIASAIASYLRSEATGRFRSGRNLGLHVAPRAE